VSLEPEGLVRAYVRGMDKGYSKRPLGMVELFSTKAGEIACCYLRSPRLYPVVDDDLIVKSLDENWRIVRGSPSRLVMEYKAETPARGTVVEATPLKHATAFRFNFPEYISQARIVVDCRKFEIDPSGTKTIERIDSQTWRIMNTLGGEANLTGYHYIKFSAPFDAWGIFEEIDGAPQIHPGADSITGDEVGFYVEYASAQQVVVVVSTSLVDFARAEEYLGEFTDFDSAVEEAKNDWNEALSVVEVEGGGTVKEALYTHLFTVLGNIINYEDESPLLSSYYSPIIDVASSPKYNYYKQFTRCYWDQSRFVYPLIALLDHDLMNHILNTGVASHSRYGYMPVNFDCVGGDHHDWNTWASKIFLEAHLYGVPFDYSSAYAAVKDTTDRDSYFFEYGYDPYEYVRYCTTMTIEMASTSDFQARLAKCLGLEADYEYYSKFRDAWRNNWDGDYPRGKYADGSWIPVGEGFFEEDWRYYRLSPAWNDPFGLIEGLRAEAFEKVREILELYMIYNDYQLIYPILPYYLGKWSYSQRYIRRYSLPLFFYAGSFEVVPWGQRGDGKTPAGHAIGYFYPSNAAYAVWHILGLVPVPGTRSMLIVAPSIEEAVIHAAGGEITVKAPGARHPLDGFKMLDNPYMDNAGNVRVALDLEGEGYLILEPEGGWRHRAISSRLSVENFILKLRCLLHPGSETAYMEVRFRASDNHNWLCVRLGSDGVAALERSVDGVVSTLYSVDYTPPLDEWFNLEVGVEDSMLEVKIDNSNILTYDNLLLGEGHVGLSIFYSGEWPPPDRAYLKVDRWSLLDISGEVLQEEDFNPIYVVGVKLNGDEWPSFLVPLDKLIGGRLELEVSSTPELRKPMILAADCDIIEARYELGHLYIKTEGFGKGHLLIDCGVQGEPIRVEGAYHEYDLTGDLLKLTVEHSSPAEINIYWKIYPKKIIIDLLSDPEDGVKVYDDEGQPIPGVISAAWYDERIFKEADWQITVGPIAGARAEILDIGARHKAVREHIQLSIWVKRKPEANYTPERLRRDLIQEVERILFKAINNLSGVEGINLSRWIDRDEPERGILRSILTVQVEYEMERG